MQMTAEHNAQGAPRRKGIVAVETALLLPLFIFLLFIGIEFGRMFWMQTVLGDAANEGARLAILNEPTDTDVESVIRDRLEAQGVEKNILVTIGTREPGQPVAITVEAPLDMLVLPSGLMSMMNVTQLTATAVMTHVY